MSSHHPPEPRTVAERAGGVDTFRRIVDRFYASVEDDELLRPIYPDDLEPGKTHLALFLAQYFGAGPVYGARRGHPRLRMRHAPFRITPEAAAHWAAHMSDAIVAEGLDADVEQALLAYVVQATPQMINAVPRGRTSLPTAD